MEKVFKPLPGVGYLRTIALIKSVFLLASMVVAGLTLLAFFDSYYIHTNGIKTKATLLEKFIDEGEDTTDYFFVYMYSAMRPNEEFHKSYREKQSVDSSSYDRFKEGDQFDVYYFKNNPDIVSITNDLQPLILIVTLIFLITAGALIYFINDDIKKIKDNKLLNEKGEDLTGIVNDVSKDDSGDSTVYYCSYTFEFNGRHINARASVSNSEYDLLGRSLPANIQVRCLIEKPEIHQIKKR